MSLAVRLLLPFAAGYFLSFLLRNVNAVIAPDLARELGLSAADLGFLTSAYFITFSLIQLPLGILLDRYGSRRVETVLLLIAASGSALFYVGGNFAELTIARALIGLGVSACLMASFKALSVWYPPERLASLNSAIMVAGGLGALAATTPLVAAVDILGWRNVFLVLSVLTVLIAGAIFVTPEKKGSVATESFKEQLGTFQGILKSRTLWAFVPMTATNLGGFVALQGLWAVPWLMEVTGETRDSAAFHMLLTTVAMVCGWLATAVFVQPLRRIGVSPGLFMTICIAAGAVTMLLIWFGVGNSLALWFARGFFFAVGNLAFAELTARFSSALAGRVNTALNFCTFMGALIVQFGYGLLLDFLRSSGLNIVDAHRIAFGLLTLLQFCGLSWYVLQSRRRPAAI
jgi:MFS family permease